MQQLVSIVLACLITVCSYSAQAHHAFSATFVKDKKTSVQGVVTKFSFRNPHVLLYFDVTSEDGSKVNWMSEGNSATLLRRSGWDKDSFKAGDVIKVTGDSSRDDSPMTSIDFVEVLDPETLAVAEVKVRDNSLELYKPATADSVPLALEDGRPNLNLVWAIQYRGFGPPPVPAVPLNGRGMTLQNVLSLADDPQVFCDPPGLARQAVTHHPIRFTLNDDHVLIQYEEFAGLRKIYFDDRAAKGANTHLGDSIARYEGNKLIIETTNLLSDYTTTEGNRLSDDAKMVETYHRVDESAERTALNLNIVLSDPAFMTEDLVVNKVLWDAGTDYEMLENDCHSPLRDRAEVSPAMNYFVPDMSFADTLGIDEPATLDAQCQLLASTIKQGSKEWLALVGNSNVEAMGAGPWYNAKGELLAVDTAKLFSADLEPINQLGKTADLGDKQAPFSCFATGQQW